MWKKKEKVVMFCPRCQENIQETDHAGITPMRSVVPSDCGACPGPGGRIIDEGLYKNMFKK